MTKNHFAVLGLKAGAGEAEIKKAYRSLAMKWHPDKNRAAGAEEKFKEIGASYEYLQSKDRRELLERELTRPAQPPSTTKPTTTTTRPGGFANPAAPTASASYASSSNKQSYNWNYKGTEKNDPPPKPSTSTQSGSRKQSPDESASFSSKKTKGKSKAKTDQRWKPWSGEAWDDAPPSTPEFFDVPPPRAQFSEAFSKFKVFVDQMNGGNIFFGGVFGEEDLFGGLGGLGPPPRARPKPGPKVKRDPNATAPQHGYSGGLDDDLLFDKPKTPRTPEAKTVRCPICRQMIPPSKVEWHARYCGKFDAPSDTDDESRHTPTYKRRVFVSSDEDDDDYFSEGQGTHRRESQDWRDTHEDVLNKMRRDRQAYQAKLNRQKAEEYACEWCGRSFNLQALQRHLPLCKEHVMRYGKPMNPMFGGAGPPPRRDSTFSRARQYAQNVPRPGASGSSADNQHHSSPTDPGPSTSQAQQPGNMRPPRGKGPMGKENNPSGGGKHSPGTGSSSQASPQPGTSKSPGASKSNNSANNNNNNNNNNNSSSRHNHKNNGQFGGGVSGQRFSGTGFRPRSGTGFKSKKATTDSHPHTSRNT